MLTIECFYRRYDRLLTRKGKRFLLAGIDKSGLANSPTVPGRMLGAWRYSGDIVPISCYGETGVISLKSEKWRVLAV